MKESVFHIRFPWKEWVLGLRVVSRAAKVAGTDTISPSSLMMMAINLDIWAQGIVLTLNFSSRKIHSEQSHKKISTGFIFVISTLLVQIIFSDGLLILYYMDLQWM